MRLLCILLPQSDADSIDSSERGLVIVDQVEDEGEMEDLKTPSVEEGEDGLLSPSHDSLEDLPVEALLATTVNQFGSCLRPILMGRYPVATSAEINSIITKKWKNLKEARRKQAGSLCECLCTMYHL